MKLLYKLEYKFRRYAISNLMLYICAGMAVVFVASYLFDRLDTSLYALLSFDRAAVLRGEVWRVLSFVILPPNSNPIWIVFSILFYYILGSALEREWGSFYFNAYYLLGVLGTIICGFIAGGATNNYLNLSLLFAFAVLFPDYEFRIYFLIPIKVKWIALFDALAFIWQFVTLFFVPGGLSYQLSLIVAVVNFVVFFGKDFIDKLRDKIRYGKTRRDFRKAMRK